MKTAARNRRINKSKTQFREQHEPCGCMTCGSTSDHLGVSHTISIADIMGDGDIDISVCWDKEGFTIECHTGNCCHQLTESKNEGDFKAKSEQRNFIEKMRFIRKHQPKRYDYMKYWYSVYMPDVEQRLKDNIC